MGLFDPLDRSGYGPGFKVPKVRAARRWCPGPPGAGAGSGSGRPARGGWTSRWRREREGPPCRASGRGRRPGAAAGDGIRQGADAVVPSRMTAAGEVCVPRTLCCSRDAHLLPRAEALVHERCRVGAVPPTRGHPASAASTGPLPPAVPSALDHGVMAAGGAAPSGVHTRSLGRRRLLPPAFGAGPGRPAARSGGSEDPPSTVRTTPRRLAALSSETPAPGSTPRTARRAPASRRGGALRRPEPGRGAQVVGGSR